jgi:peptide/nickel transport system substrate-binding protein
MVVVLLVSGICLLGASPILAGEEPVGQYDTLQDYEKLTGERIEEFGEALMLRTMVAAGELPPVEERLPDEPLVVIPIEKVGQYGGTWRMVTLGRHEIAHAGCWLARRKGLVAGSLDAASVIPNIAKSWEISDGGKIFTFHLRKGMKWSDGHLLTADDIMFWYEDMLLNKEITPVFPSWLTVGGESGKIGRVDDYTIRFIFAKAYVSFLDELAKNWWGTFTAKHYMKKFHPDYTPKKELEKMVKEAGFDHWYELYQDKDDFWGNPERPTLDAWKIVTPFGESTQVSLERNPYYWKVDTAGNQLPYIDKVVISIVSTVQIAEMKGIAGEIDLQGSPVGENLTNYPMFMENSEKGNYTITLQPDGWSDVAYYFNLNHENPVLRKIFRDKRFRVAMSLAIDRQEIVKRLYPAWDIEIGQISPEASAPYYYEPLAKQYLEYDPERANQILDEVGLDKRSPDGWRLGPDGKVLSIIMEVPTFTQLWVDMSELITLFWQEVGIKATLKSENPERWGERLSAGEHDGTFAGTGAAERPLAYFAYVPLYRTWGLGAACPKWSLWYESKGESGEEPSPEMKKLLELYDEIMVTMDGEKKVELIKKIMKINAENFWMGGIIAQRPGKIRVKKNYVRNVLPDLFGGSGVFGYVSIGNPCQYFFER